MYKRSSNASRRRDNLLHRNTSASTIVKRVESSGSKTCIRGLAVIPNTACTAGSRSLPWTRENNDLIGETTSTWAKSGSALKVSVRKPRSHCNSPSLKNGITATISKADKKLASQSRAKPEGKRKLTGNAASEVSEKSRGYCEERVKLTNNNIFAAPLRSFSSGLCKDKMSSTKKGINPTSARRSLGAIKKDDYEPLTHSCSDNLNFIAPLSMLEGQSRGPSEEKKKFYSDIPRPLVSNRSRKIGSSILHLKRSSFSFFHRFYKADSSKLMLVGLKGGVEGLKQFFEASQCRKLYINDVSNGVLHGILDQLAGYPKLVEVELDTWGVEWTALLQEKLSQVCNSSSRTLTSLMIRCRMQADLLGSLLQLIPASVISLDISNNMVGENTELAEILVALIERNQMKRLIMKNCGVGKNFNIRMFKLLEALDSNLSLQVLDGVDFFAVPDVPPEILGSGATISSQRYNVVCKSALPLRGSNNHNRLLLEYLRNRSFVHKLIGTTIRVWWPPTDDMAKTDYSGRYWPAKVIGVDPLALTFALMYDNGEYETVCYSMVQPLSPFEYGGGLSKVPSPDSSCVKTPDIDRIPLSRKRAINYNPENNSEIFEIGRQIGRSSSLRTSNEKGNCSEPLLQRRKINTNKESATSASSVNQHSAYSSTPVRFTRQAVRNQTGSSPASLKLSLLPSSSNFPLKKKEGLKSSEAKTRVILKESSCSATTRKREDFEEENQTESFDKKHTSEENEENFFEGKWFSQLVEKELDIPCNFVGNVLFEGDICEFRDSNEGIGSDPSDYIGIVKTVKSEEPLYKVRYIYQDDEQYSDVCSFDIRRAVVVSWEDWRDWVLRFDRLKSINATISRNDSFPVFSYLESLKDSQLKSDDDLMASKPFLSLSPMSMPKIDSLALGWNIKQSRLAIHHPRKEISKAFEHIKSLKKSAIYEKFLAIYKENVLLKTKIGKVCAVGMECEKLRASVDLLNTRIASLENEMSCIICLSRRSSCVVKPCMHFQFCGECVNSLKACPLCRTKITKVVKLSLV